MTSRTSDEFDFPGPLAEGDPEALGKGNRRHAGLEVAAVDEDLPLREIYELLVAVRQEF
jgi:hypothetical protein